MIFSKNHKNDILLVLAFFIAAGAIGLYAFLTRSGGKYAVAEINGQEIARLPLDRDTQVVLGEGDKTNTLVIENGEAFISEASCPDHLCIGQGRIKYNGEMIVCLPNKLIISVDGGDEPAVDAATN